MKELFYVDSIVNITPADVTDGHCGCRAKVRHLLHVGDAYESLPARSGGAALLSAAMSDAADSLVFRFTPDGPPFDPDSYEVFA